MGPCADQSQEINSLYGQEASYFCPLRIKNSADCMLQWHHNEQHCSPQKQWWGSGSPARCPRFTAHSFLACWRLVPVNHSLLHGDMGRLPLSLNPHQSPMPSHLHFYWASYNSTPLHHPLFLWQCSADNLRWGSPPGWMCEFVWILLCFLKPWKAKLREKL